MKTLLAIGYVIGCLTASAATWTFDSESATNHCAVRVGRFGEGWMDNVLGAQGVWNLGSGGALFVNAPVASNSVQQVTVEVVAWFDGWIFPPPTIAVADAELIDRTETVERAYAFGYWMRFTSTWAVETKGDSVTVAVYQPNIWRDAAIDAVTVDTAAPRPREELERAVEAIAVK